MHLSLQTIFATLFFATLMVSSASTIQLQEENESQSSLRGLKISKVQETYSCPSECAPTQSLDHAKELILTNQAVMTNDSCNAKRSGEISIKFQYITSPITILGSESTEDSSLAGGPSIPNPGTDITEFIFGHSLETNEKSESGYCIDLPDVIHGPFPIEQLQACTSRMEAYCEDIETSMCPCFEYQQIRFIEKQIVGDARFVLDMNLSCKLPELNHSLPYGIYRKAFKNQELPTLIAGTDVRADKMFPPYYGNCFQKTIMGPEMTKDQARNCIGLVDYICKSLKPLPVEKCSDEPTYAKNRIDDRTCSALFPQDFLSDNSTQRRCGKTDYFPGKMVSEHCRKSCGSCTCTDDTDFYFNGQADRGCDWIADHPEYCEDYDVARFCKQTCGTPCCRDNYDFRFEYNKKSGYRCELLQNIWEDACKDDEIAQNCPMSCRKCEIQPMTVIID
mmetsp:Transcript_9327/g.11803  ORF Transcript_9327/g.11803 Transcript_9327/m.11803 type:complete len:449 (-) Transcript_9327:732-2078(-)